MLSLHDFFGILPEAELEHLAAEYELDSTNRMKLTGPQVFLCLLNGLLSHPELSQRLLEETYKQQNGVAADHSSFSKFLSRERPDFFRRVFERLYDRVAPQISRGTAQALRVRRVDATTVSLSAKLLRFGLLNRCQFPGKERKLVKSVIEINAEGVPNLLRVCKEKPEHNDNIAIGHTIVAAARPNDLFVFDAGCNSRERMLDLHGRSAYFLTPLSTQKLQISEVVLEREVPDECGAAPGKGDPDCVISSVECAHFENTSDTIQLRDRLRLMPVVIVNAVRFDDRSKKWKPISFVTNLPISPSKHNVAGFSFEQICDLYKSRWEIELFFRCIKQHLTYDHLLSRSENGIFTMIYMSLIAALLMIWYRAKTCIDRGWRSVKFRLQHDVQMWTEQILAPNTS